MRRRGGGLVIAAMTALGVAACSRGTSAPQAAPLSSSASPVTTTPTAPQPGRTVWLCRPGQQPDPCTSDLSATAVTATGSHIAVPAPTLPRHLAADCFYVYPTVSAEKGRNADLRVQAAERNVAFAQASRFSTACRVWAPIYRQRTVSDLTNLADMRPDSAPNRIAFESLRSAWRDYVAHDNHGRPVVLIGHSQGAAMLIRLIAADLDNDSSLRQRVALAIVLGGNLTVADGRTTGGSFRHLPLCSHPRQARCVIAYSSFPSEPPAAAFFGRPGQGVSALSGQTPRAGVQVACVNPARIGGGPAPLHPYLPTELARSGVLTPWTTYPDRYTSVCRHRDGATWLQVTPTHIRNDVRPLLPEQLGSLWGFHTADVNLALGDLVDDVTAAVRTWQRR